MYVYVHEYVSAQIHICIYTYIPKHELIIEKTPVPSICVYIHKCVYT